MATVGANAGPVGCLKSRTCQVQILRQEGQSAFIVCPTEDPSPEATAERNPITMASEEFCDLTGYGMHDLLGRNCRFLQGPGTDMRAVQNIQACISKGLPCVQDILNYRKVDQRAAAGARVIPFWNLLQIEPVFDSSMQRTSCQFASQLVRLCLRTDRQ
jgi:PAS domain-containing protein